MPFLTEVRFQNYRSFLDAKCRVRPVTVVIGANNAGKSNFLKGLQCLANAFSDDVRNFRGQHHRSEKGSAPMGIVGLRSGGLENSSFGEEEELKISAEQEFAEDAVERNGYSVSASVKAVFHTRTLIYSLDAAAIGGTEKDSERPFVHSNGEGMTRVLQLLSLKQRKNFQKLEEEFQTYLPEVEELTFERAEQGKWFIQVAEKGFKDPVSLSELSEGSRTILALLTILYQPNRPELILFEDIEHAIHPRGLRPMLETIRRISKEHGVQVIMTTQSPYVLDCFQDKEFWADVVIVEKTDGVSRLTNANERLVALGYDEEKMETVSLGDLWYSGLLGGVAGPNELWDEPPADTTQP